ncbi:MAG: DUF1499 domain-containing protein [Pseudomonadales bacterium]|nr:DUF1499 domain-containing protein [Pseudomonadales bacterium]
MPFFLKRLFFSLTVISMAFSLSACSGTRPENLGLNNGKFLPCPDSPNCVSSDEDPDDEQHFIEAIAGKWENVLPALVSQEHIKIITKTDNYIYAISSSRIFRYVDDLELHYRPATKTIAIRSASRLGYGDMGVNRKRVERLRGLIDGQ